MNESPIIWRELQERRKSVAHLDDYRRACLLHIVLHLFRPVPSRPGPNRNVPKTAKIINNQSTNQSINHCIALHCIAQVEGKVEEKLINQSINQTNFDALLLWMIMTMLLAAAAVVVYFRCCRYLSFIVCNRANFLRSSVPGRIL